MAPLACATVAVLKTPTPFATAFFLTQLGIGIIIIGLILLFYRVIYGILLKRLKGNYNELRKMEA